MTLISHFYNPKDQFRPTCYPYKLNFGVYDPKDKLRPNFQVILILFWAAYTAYAASYTAYTGVHVRWCTLVYARTLGLTLRTLGWTYASVCVRWV